MSFEHKKRGDNNERNDLSLRVMYSTTIFVGADACAKIVHYKRVKSYHSFR